MSKAGRKRHKERAATPAEPLVADFVPARAFTWREAWAILGLGVLVVASYWPATGAGFVWDDFTYIISNDVRRWSGLWATWFAPVKVFTALDPGSGNTAEPHYWPVTYTSFWLEHKLWGLDPTGYHVVNVLLHLANTILLLRLMQRLVVPGAWLIAAVFAVHPLHVESVAWVMERKDLLSGLFYFTAVLVWLRFEEAPDRRRYALVIVLFVAGMLSKSIVVTLPAALLILAWWKRGAVSITDLSRVWPLLAVGLFIALVDLAIYRTREAVSFDFSLIERGLLAARLLWFYAGKLLWPVDLAVIYALPAPDAADPVAWGYAVAVCAVAALGWMARHRIGRGPLAGVLFFAVTLSPVLGFVDFGWMQFSFAADRFQYLAGIGVIAVVAGGAAHAAGRLSGASRKGLQVLALAVLVALGTLTWRYSSIWQDGVTLFSHVVSSNPRARSAHTNLGAALLEEGRLEESLAASRIAVEQRPDDFDAHRNLGLGLVRLNRYDEAERHYRRALELDSRHPAMLSGLGRLRLREARFEEALALFQAAVEIDPDNAETWSNRGFALYRLERYDEALRSFDRALSFDPFLESARTGREQARAGGRGTWALRDSANSLRQQGRHEEAIALYAETLESSPDLAGAHAGMGLSLLATGRYEEGLRALERAVALDPDSQNILSLRLAMGQGAEEAGRPEAAVEYYERLLEAAPRHREALSRLGVLRFGEKRFEEALALFRAMVEVAPDNAQAWANQGAALYNLKRYDEALRSFDRALSLDPTLESAQLGREQARARIRGTDEPAERGG